MTTENLFEQQTTADQGTKQNTDTLFADQLKEIVNDKGEQKYKSPEDAFSALKHSQAYIPQLKDSITAKDAEIAALRAQIEKFSNIDETVRKLAQKQEHQEAPPPTGLDDETLQKKILSTLDAQTKQARIKTNQQDVVDALVAQYGTEGAGKYFYSQAQELGLSPEAINQMAGESPQAVLKLLGVQGKTKQSSVTPPSGKVNTAALKGNADSLISRETSLPGLGATDRDYRAAVDRSKSMIEELDKEGLTVQDLTDPQTFFKYFN